MDVLTITKTQAGAACVCRILKHFGRQYIAEQNEVSKPAWQIRRSVINTLAVLLYIINHDADFHRQFRSPDSIRTSISWHIAEHFERTSTVLRVDPILAALHWNSTGQNVLTRTTGIVWTKPSSLFIDLKRQYIQIILKSLETNT